MGQRQRPITIFSVPSRLLSRRTVEFLDREGYRMDMAASLRDGVNRIFQQGVEGGFFFIPSKQSKEFQIVKKLCGMTTKKVVAIIGSADEALTAELSALGVFFVLSPPLNAPRLLNVLGRLYPLYANEMKAQKLAPKATAPVERKDARQEIKRLGPQVPAQPEEKEKLIFQERAKGREYNVRFQEKSGETSEVEEKVYRFSNAPLEHEKKWNNRLKTLEETSAESDSESSIQDASDARNEDGVRRDAMGNELLSDADIAELLSSTGSAEPEDSNVQISERRANRGDSKMFKGSRSRELSAVQEGQEPSEELSLQTGGVRYGRQKKKMTVTPEDESDSALPSEPSEPNRGSAARAWGRKTRAAEEKAALSALEANAEDPQSLAGERDNRASVLDKTSPLNTDASASESPSRSSESGEESAGDTDALVEALLSETAPDSNEDAKAAEALMALDETTDVTPTRGGSASADIVAGTQVPAPQETASELSIMSAVTAQEKMSAVTAQETMSAVTAQETMSAVTAQEKMSAVTAQETMSAVTAQETAGPVVEKSAAPPPSNPPVEKATQSIRETFSRSWNRYWDDDEMLHLVKHISQTYGGHRTAFFMVGRESPEPVLLIDSKSGALGEVGGPIDEVVQKEKLQDVIAAILSDTMGSSVMKVEHLHVGHICQSRHADAFVVVDGNGFDGGAARLTRDLNDVKPSLRMPLLGKMRLIDVYQEFYRENSNVKKVA